MSEPGRILVLAPNWLGDAVMALPAIADVRRHFPRARIIAAARRRLPACSQMVPAVDEVVELRWNGTLLRPGARRDDAARLRAVAADAAILLPNSFAAAGWSGARRSRSAGATRPTCGAGC